jgi:L-threonylcarbamoyladenylate synthase
VSEVAARVFEIDPADVRPSTAGSRSGTAVEDALVAARKALAAAQLVVLPTETVYGLAARPDLPEATSRLFAAKRRPHGLSLPVLARSADSAFGVGEPNAAASALAEAFWPGPLTLVLRRTARSRTWALGEDPATIAVRVPDHALCLALLERTGPLAATSANRSGSPPLAGLESLVSTFGLDVAVYLVLAARSEGPRGQPSTVVDATVEEVRVLREGAIPGRDLQAALAKSAPRRNR